MIRFDTRRLSSWITATGAYICPRLDGFDTERAGAEGTPKQVTVSLSAGKWHVAIQTEREVSEPVHVSAGMVGIDMGIVRFATLSDGMVIAPLNSFRNHAARPAREQRGLSRKVKFSANWRKQQGKVQRVHDTIGNVRNDFLHKATTGISKNHAVIVLEDLRVKALSASASDALEHPGRNVRAKSGLNKAILDQGWARSSGTLLLVPPQYTNQACHVCGNAAKSNRVSLARFVYAACGYAGNADDNAALEYPGGWASRVSLLSGKGSSARVEAGTSRGRRVSGFRRNPPALRGGEDVNDFLCLTASLVLELLQHVKRLWERGKDEFLWP